MRFIRISIASPILVVTMARKTKKPPKTMKAKGGGAKGGAMCGGAKGKGGAAKGKGGAKAKDKGKDTETKVKEMGKNNEILRDKGNGKGKDEGERKMWSHLTSKTMTALSPKTMMGFYVKTLSDQKVNFRCHRTETVSKVRASLPIDWVNVQPHNILIMKIVPFWCSLREANIEPAEELYAVNREAFYEDLFTVQKEEEAKEKDGKKKKTAE